MSFREAQEFGDESRAAASGNGLAMEWRNLQEHRCPMCGDELFEFTYRDMHKCPCGFKITGFRYAQLLKNMEEGSTRGYSFGNYDDEPPF